MNHKRSFHAIVKVDSFIYAFGGFISFDNDGYQKSVEVYDICENSWEEIEDMPYASAFASWVYHYD